MEMRSGQPMRADARRNYEALVSVARKHLTSQGVTTSLEAIAREAGVGPGTLYRHFPDRADLVFAALNAQGQELRAASDRIRREATSPARLDQWLTEVEHYLSSYQGLPDSIADALDCGEGSPLAITCQEVIAITEEFLADARDRGSVREGVTGRDLFQTTLMVAWLGSQTSGQLGGHEGVRDIIRHGYRV